jgi:hypothetical protein
MQNEVMSEQLWGTVLAFDALREQLLHTCFRTEVMSLGDTTSDLKDFLEGMKELVVRYDTLLAGMEGQAGRDEAQVQEGAGDLQESANTTICRPLHHTGCITSSE